MKNRQKWDKDELEIFKNLYYKYGSNWTRIAKIIKGRYFFNFLP